MVCLIVLIVKVNLWSVCQDAEAGAPWIYRTFGWWELLFSPCGFVTKWCDLKVCFSWSPFVLLCCSTWRVAVNPWLDATVTLQKGYLRVFSSSASCVDRNKTFHMKAHPDRRNEEWGERMFLCKQPSLDLLSMENMISWICRGWRGPLRSHSTPSARAGSPEQVVQHSAYTGSEYPQRRAVHHLSAQPVPVLPFIKVSIMWRHPVVPCWTSIAVYQSSQCVVRWNSCARYFAWSSLYWLCLLQTSWVFPCPLKSVVWL